MKTSLPKLKNSLIPFFILIFGISNAQTIHRNFKFKKGDEFQRQIVIKSNSVLARGDQKLNISSYSAVTKTYKVIDVAGRDPFISITINKIVDTVNAMGQKMEFNSDKKPDPNSDIQMALMQLIGKSAVISVDDKGAIATVQKRIPMNDTLLSFTGMQAEHLYVHNTLEFLLDFPSNSFLKKGFTWADATPTSETNFTIHAITSRTTTITYTSSDRSDNLNSRINGVILIDNESGIILKRATQSVTTGYELVKGVIYTATRRTATSEVCYKKPASAK